MAEHHARSKAVYRAHAPPYGVRFSWLEIPGEAEDVSACDEDHVLTACGRGCAMHTSIADYRCAVGSEQTGNLPIRLYNRPHSPGLSDKG
jgi:hypothetical protein